MVLFSLFSLSPSLSYTPHPPHHTNISHIQTHYRCLTHHLLRSCAHHLCAVAVHSIKVENIDNEKLGKIISLFAMNNVNILKLYVTKKISHDSTQTVCLSDSFFLTFFLGFREREDGYEAGKLTVTMTLQLPKHVRPSPKLMADILRGVEGVTMAGM